MLLFPQALNPSSQDLALLPRCSLGNSCQLGDGPSLSPGDPEPFSTSSL